MMTMSMVRAQQEARLRDERHADLEQRDVAVRQGAGLPAREMCEPDALERAVDFFGDAAVARGGAERMQEALLGLRRDPQVLGNAQPRKHALDLQRALDAEPADVVRLETGDVAPGKEDASVVGREQAGDEIEQGGLAGAVRADDGVQPSARERVAQVVDRDEAAEALGETLDAQDRLAHGSTCTLVLMGIPDSPRGSRSVTAASQSRHSPTSPLGAKITTRMATRPTISS